MSVRSGFGKWIVVVALAGAACDDDGGNSVDGVYSEFEAESTFECCLNGAFFECSSSDAVADCASGDTSGCTSAGDC